MVCMTLVSHGQLLGGGCNAPTTLLYDGPFTMGESIAEGGDQYAVLTGVANDDVARMTLYQANGEVVPVPLRDNFYAVRALRAAYPVRLVASDAAGRVIGIKTFRVGSPKPEPGAACAGCRVEEARDHDRRTGPCELAVGRAGRRRRHLLRASYADGTDAERLPAEPLHGLDARRQRHRPRREPPVLVAIVGDAVTRVTVRYPDGFEDDAAPGRGVRSRRRSTPRTEDGEALQVKALDEDGVTIGQARLDLRR